MEQFVLEAIQRELSLPHSKTAVRTRAANELLLNLRASLVATIHKLDSIIGITEESTGLGGVAAEFVRQLPVPIVIKHLGPDFQVTWCNPAYETVVGKSAANIIGRSTRDVLGITQDHVAATHITLVATTGRVTPSIEEFLVGSRQLTYITYRFIVEDPVILRSVVDYPRRWIGDLSFEFNACNEAAKGKSLIPLPDAFASERVNNPPIELLSRFLEQLPTAAAVKDTQGVILWCNDAYLEITPFRSSKDIIGKTASEVFVLPGNHTVPRHDAEVVNEGHAILSTEVLPGLEPRMSLRFPILDSGGLVEYIGLVSTELNSIKGSDQIDTKTTA